MTVWQEKFLHWEETISVANQCITEKRWKEVELSSSKLNEKEEQLPKLNVRNFNKDGMRKF